MSTTQTQAPAQEQKSEKAPKEQRKELFATEAEALAEANARTKGPRRAFTCTLGGKTHHVVANNEGRAAGVAFLQHGGKVVELGERAKRAKPLGVDGVMAAINALPEAERAAILAQLKSLPGGQHAKK
jgi:hypothetical protein